MRVKIIPYLLFPLILTLACSSDEPTSPANDDLPPVLSKMVAIGNSLTAGVQSGGLVIDFQLNSYPYLIARQTGSAGDFQQPLIAAPGISEIDTSGGEVYGPMKFENGQIVRGDPVPGGVDGVSALFINAFLPRAYDNLGLPGADVYDILNATGGGIYDAVLRNPYFGNTTALQQAASLNPTLILLWVGNNDVLGAALAGGDLSRITAVSDFRTRLRVILDQLIGIRDSSVVIVQANIPDVSDIPYVNLLDHRVYRTVPSLGIPTAVPVVFDANFQPLSFDTTGLLYLPLLTEEPLTEVQHLLLPFLSEYAASGLGVPDSAAMIQFGISPPMVNTVLQELSARGIVVGGQPIPASYTLTREETSIIAAAVADFNQVILELAGQNDILLVDAHAMHHQLNTTGIDGYSGKFVFFDRDHTAFSLDGVHPSNGGYALIANAFIEQLNLLPDVSITPLNTADFQGQYSGNIATGIEDHAARQAAGFFTN